MFNRNTTQESHWHSFTAKMAAVFKMMKDLSSGTLQSSFTSLLNPTPEGFPFHSHIECVSGFQAVSGLQILLFVFICPSSTHVYNIKGWFKYQTR